LALPDLIEAHARRRQTISERLVRILLRLWLGFDGWNDRDLVTVQAAQSATYVEAAIREMRQVSRTYTRLMLREVGASTGTLPSFENIYPRSAIDTLEVYERPAKKYRWELYQGQDPEQALRNFEQRLTTVAGSDIAAANRDEAATVMESSPDVIGYRRVIHPELSRSGTCGLCIAAATRFYKRGDLSAIHGDSCKCEVVAVTKANDPGLRLNDADLKRLYEAAGGNTADELREVRAETVRHGELGPLLVREGDHFRGPEEVGRPEYSKPTGPEQIAKLADRRLRLVDTLTDLEKRYDAGEGNLTKLFDAIRSAERTIDSLDQRLAA